MCEGKLKKIYQECSITHFFLTFVKEKFRKRQGNGALLIPFLYIYVFGCVTSQLGHAGALLHHVGLSLPHTDSNCGTGFRAQGLRSCHMWAWLLCSMWDLSSPMRNQTHVPALKILTHWTTRKVPYSSFLTQPLNVSCEL